VAPFGAAFGQVWRRRGRPLARLTPFLARTSSQSLEPSAAGRITADDHIPSAAEHSDIFDQELAKLNAETNGAISEDNFDTYGYFARSEPNGDGTVRAVKVESFGETRGPGNTELLALIRHNESLSRY
jgi:hypothetical protein